MEDVLEAGFVILGSVVIGAGIGLLLTLPTLWLWNWLMPVIFGLPVINFWQALGLNLLSGLLIKNYSGKSS